VRTLPAETDADVFPTWIWLHDSRERRRCVDRIAKTTKIAREAAVGPDLVYFAFALSPLMTVAFDRKK
jgi:hypothetical protein